MFIINERNNKMKIVQGDSGIIELSLDNHKLQIGDIVYFTVKKNYKSENAIQKIIKDFSVEGVAEIKLEPSETNIPSGVYLYDIQINLVSGIVDTVIISEIEVLGGVTGA